MRIEHLLAGPLALAVHWEGGVVSRLELGWSAEAQDFPPPSSESGRALQRALDAYVQGREPAWPELPLEEGRLSPFARSVLGTLRERVGFGRTTTYGRLASMCGRPGAARAVGRAMASNPWPLVVPCHRVLGSGGRLTGFSGSGLPMKRFLLELESRIPPG
jgi:methylated-DNA-[protein]-cysteine S-methyltransferase